MNEEQIRADERDKVAYYILAELVCCDIHERLEAEAAKGHWDEDKHQYVMPKSWRDLKRSSDYHPMCHFGGWAASLAKQGPEHDTRHEGWAWPWPDVIEVRGRQDDQDSCADPS